jgi:hypothetical protein
MRSTKKSQILLLLFTACYTSGCAATPILSVQLVHPKTKAMRTCSARESTSKDIPMLTDAVEACARQLEARGFIRVESSPTPSEESNR